jgi:hypothetical protein
MKPPYDKTPSATRLAIEAALEAGPSEDWSLSRNGHLGVVLGGPVKQFTNGSSQSQIIMTCVTDGEENKQATNAQYVHACNPAAMRQLLQEHDTEVARLTAELADEKERVADLEFMVFKVGHSHSYTPSTKQSAVKHLASNKVIWTGHDTGTELSFRLAFEARRAALTQTQPNPQEHSNG